MYSKDYREIYYMDYDTNYEEPIPAQQIRKRVPAQQYYHEEPRKYANIPRTNETNPQRRPQNDEPHNERFNGHEKRRIPLKQTNTDLVNDLTDRFMELNYPSQPAQSADETIVVYTAPKSRFQSVEKNSRPTRPPARDNFNRHNYLTQNRVELSSPRPFRPTTSSPEPAIQPGHSLATAEVRRSEATEQMTGLGFNSKHCESKNQPLIQRISKEKINVYGDEGNGEPMAVLNMEEMASGCVDPNVLERQKKQFSNVVDEALQLEKTKSIVVELIDNALEKLKSKRFERKVSETSFTGSHSQMKQMKNSCFKKIEDELKLLKTLDSFSTENE